MLMRFDPWRELDRLTEELWTGTRRPGMPMDAYRDGERFVVHFDLPGVDADSIDLTIEQNVLTVKAERNFAPTEGAEVLINERPTGTYVRRIFLGEGLDTDHLEANYDNGVLTVTIPVAEAAKPKRIEVTAGGSPKAIEAEATTKVA